MKLKKFLKETKRDRKKQREIERNKEMEECSCYYCGTEMDQESTKNNFPPCEICNKVFDLKTFDLCSDNCTAKFFEDFNEENIFNCRSCNVKSCLCDCRFMYFNDKESCSCFSCINNYDETLCKKCNALEKM